MSLQIKGKFISSEAIDGQKLLLQSGQAIRLMSASGEVRLIELDESTGKVKVNGVVVALQPDLAAEINRAVLAETTLQSNIDAEASARAAADSALATAVQAAIEAEASARVATDTSLQGTISSVSSALSQEVSDRQAGDASTLSSANSYTDTKVAALVDSAPEILNTLKELSDALGGDASFASTVSGQIGSVSSSLSAEVTRATSAESVLQSGLTAVEVALAQELSDRSTAVAEVQASVDAVDIALTAEIANRIADVDQEEARALAAEAVLQAQIDTLSGGSGSGSLSLSSLDTRLDVLEGSGEGSVAKAEQDAKDYADAAVLVEKTRAEAAEGVLTSSIAQEVSDRQAAITQLSTSTQALIQAEADARVADVNDEEARAMAAESALNTRLNVLEGSGEGSVAKAEADAKAYADQKVADLVNSAPAVLDTLQELAAAINNDASFAATVAGQIGSVAADLATEQDRALAAEGAIAADLAIETANRISDVNAEESRAMAAESGLASDIDAEQTRAEAAEAGLAADISAEETRAMGVESALDGRLDVLEAREHRKMKFVLSAQDITNGYVDLAHEAMANSVVAAVGRLMIHEGASEDFTMSVVGGVSRLTFVGNLVEPSEEKLSAGDIIYVKYFA